MGTVLLRILLPDSILASIYCRYQTIEIRSFVSKSTISSRYWYFFSLSSASSHTVDESTSPASHGNVIFQFCDIYDSDIRKILDSRASFLNEFNSVSGWYKYDVKQRILGLLKLKWREDLKDHPLRRGGGSLRMHSSDSRSSQPQPSSDAAAFQTPLYGYDSDSYSIYEEEDYDEWIQPIKVLFIAFDLGLFYVVWKLCVFCASRQPNLVRQLEFA